MTSYIYNMVDTWALSGGPYTSIKMNATDNDAASASLLMDLQVGAASKFKISKDGLITMADSTIAWGTTGLTLTRGSGLNMLIGSFVSAGQNGVTLANGTGIAYTASASPSTAQDLFLARRAAANLRLGAADAAAPVAQTLSVQSVVAGTTNTAGANLTITGSQGTGTGAGGSIIFQVAPLGSSGSAQNALATALTIDSSQITTAIALKIAESSGRIYLGGSSGGTGTNFFANGGTTIFFTFNGSQTLSLNSTGPQVYNSGSFSWSSVATGAGTADLILTRDAANTLALRNSTAAQAFNIYNTYTSSTSFERYSVDWITTANLVIVGPNKGSIGGTQRVQRLSYLEDGGAGSTVPLLGSTCPAASGTVKSWIKVITSDGTTAYVPCWA